jgi:alginate O-acetyltransferase complex protein AlgJ
MNHSSIQQQVGVMPSGMTRRGLLAAGAGAVLSAAIVSRAAASVVGVVVVGKEGWLYPVWDEVRATDVQKIHKVTGVINEAVAILKRGGTETVISLTPAKSRVYREYLPDDFRFVPDAEKRYNVALDDLRKPGTLVPDLSALLLNLRKTTPDAQLFFKTDTHWTPAGSEPAGIEIAREIIAKNMLPPSPKPGATLGDYTRMLQAKNDLSELMPASEKSKYPGETYSIRRVATAGGAALVEDDTADTVVIGNSFTQPKYGFSDVISHQLNRPVGLFWKVHQYGPYKTLLDYVSSASFHQHRPRLIIWDFEETDMEAEANRSDIWGQNAMTADAFLSQLKAAVA